MKGRVPYKKEISVILCSVSNTNRDGVLCECRVVKYLRIVKVDDEASFAFDTRDPSIDENVLDTHVTMYDISRIRCAIS